MSALLHQDPRLARRVGEGLPGLVGRCLAGQSVISVLPPAKEKRA
ncbi:hypothetical protein MAXJ12_08579 [Mesorhizobium alhagi CCNWXJ12-2]|uniref:Uncharacterized protein n=1 Tax=Mesorhizobium alhagi CCNWXJ12-2 TaxID=1107882 RepID=H0HNJ3_9HYPH|nr:hypothetical protein [Mesorhizobium alhagi]EHK57646.1 hypothetical protein MAXJ12_08579 [Mesorhizobium alhagi CCNWXJ12-2]